MIYIRRVGPLVLHKRQRDKRKLNLIFMVVGLIISISLVLKLLELNPELTLSNLMGRSMGGQVAVRLKPNEPKSLCGLTKPCPGNKFEFKLHTGATNAIGPQICFDGTMVLKKDIRSQRQGINIVVINEDTGEVVKNGFFNMWNGRVEDLIKFLKSIEDGSFVLIATFDDPATKLNDEARRLIAALGSSYVSQIKFRDNWLFVGGKKTVARVSFEEHLKNDRGTNKYEAWPEMIEMEGCIPKLF